MYHTKRTLMEVFFEAAQKNDISSLQTYLLYPQIFQNINHQTLGDGFTALHWAAYHGHASAVSILLDHNADKNIGDNGRFAPLHYAAIANRMEVVELLLKRGAEVNVVNDVGRTPLHWVAIYEREKVLRTLLEWGADAKIRDKDGFQALQLVPLTQRHKYGRIFQEYEDRIVEKSNTHQEQEKDAHELSVSALKDEEEEDKDGSNISPTGSGTKRKRAVLISHRKEEDDLPLAARTAAEAKEDACTVSLPHHQDSPKPISNLIRPRLTFKNRITTLASLLRIKLPMPQMSEHGQETDHVEVHAPPQFLQQQGDHVIFDSLDNTDQFDHQLRTLENKLQRGTQMKSMKERIEWLEEELGIC